jgi:hypothetical protein
MHTRCRPTELLLVGRSSPFLFSGLAPCAAAFREGEVVAVVAPGPDQVVEFEGPVLSPGEAPKTIEHNVLSRSELTCSRTQALVKEQAVATEPFDKVLDGGVGDVQ